MKKSIALLIMCAVMVLGSACGSGGTSSASSTPESSTAESTAQSSEKPVEQSDSGDADLSGEVRIYSMSPDRSGYYDEMVSNYAAKNPNATLQFEVFEAGQYYSALSTSLQANDMPELFTSHGSKNANLLQYINAGVVLDLEPYISQDELGKFDEYLVQRAKVGGKLYMTPGSFMDTWPVFYNKDIFEKYNISVPSTWDEMIQAMDTLTANGIVAMGMPGKDVKGPAQVIMLIHHSMNPDWVSDMVNYKFGDAPSGNLTDPRFTEGLNEFMRWMDAGYFGSDWKGLDTNGGILEFTSGKSAMWCRGSYDKNAIAANSEINVGAFYPPTKDGKRSLIAGQDCASGFSVYAQSENLDLSLDVLNHIFAAEQMQIIADAGQNIPGRSDVKSKDPIFAELDVEKPEVILPLYSDYFGALGQEGLDTWVEYKSVCTQLAYSEITPDQFIEKFEAESIGYDIRNFDPWGDGR